MPEEIWYIVVKRGEGHLSERHRKRNKWHNAFLDAMQAELEDYGSVLDFQENVPLTEESLRMDLLIIKKTSAAVIEKNIARIFREYNIIEYKSPRDYVSVPNFQKVLSYAWLFASLRKLAERDITISLVETAHPRKLLRYLKTLDCAVTEQYPGVYMVTGLPFRIQIIESKKLSASENLWLKNLHNSLDAENFSEVLRAAQTRGKDARLNAYFEILFRANPKTVMEVENTMAPELKELIERIGLSDEVKQKVRQEGRDEILSLIKKGYTLSEIEAILQKTS
jgi:hypothetical protein